MSKAEKTKNTKTIRQMLDYNSLSVKSKHNILRTAAAIAIGLGVALVLILLTAKNPGQAVKYFLAAPL